MRDGDGGPVVARGRIKVDAERAHDKLRDHLLVDPCLYAGEVARAAVALGARTLVVAYDADDVVLGWDGRALAPAEVARARDHVLAPGEEGDDADALRSLGIAVGAALALGPSFVDVHAGATRVRFTPRETRATLESAPALPELLHGAGATACVHVRRPLGLDLVKRAVRGGPPRA